MNRVVIMIDYKQTGQRIRNQRKRIGLTQDALSEKIHITPSFYSQIETGTRKAGINTFVSISQELSVSLDYILGNNVSCISAENFDDMEYQIFYLLKSLSTKEKKLLLDIITSFKKFTTL